MMNAEQLSRVGEKLVKRCGSRDPFEIARQLGINVMLCENFADISTRIMDSSLPNTASASALETSVFPTPVSHQKQEQ